MTMLDIIPPPRGLRRWVRQFDPATFIFVHACWCVVNAMSFFLSRDMQSRPAMRFISEHHVPNWVWGSMMMVDAVMLVASLRGPLWLRSTAALTSSCFWLYFGQDVMRGALTISTYSSSGIWDIAMACGCWYATAKWAADEDYSDAS